MFQLKRSDHLFVPIAGSSFHEFISEVGYKEKRGEKQTPAHHHDNSPEAAYSVYKGDNDQDNDPNHNSKRKPEVETNA